MRLQFCVYLLLLATMLLTGGCDETSPLPLEPSPPSPAATEEPAPQRPTTQELLAGQRRRIGLGSLPFTIDAPPGWEVKTVEGTSITMLEGPTPSGEASIRLSARPTVSGERFVALVNGAKSEMQQNPESIRMVEMRSIPGARVLEIQRVGKLRNSSILSEETDGEQSPPFNWTLSLFIPRGSDYETCELNFIGLTLRQFEADGTLLRQVMDSLAVASAPATSATREAAQ